MTRRKDGRPRSIDLLKDLGYSNTEAINARKSAAEEVDNDNSSEEDGT